MLSTSRGGGAHTGVHNILTLGSLALAVVEVGGHCDDSSLNFLVSTKERLSRLLHLEQHLPYVQQHTAGRAARKGPYMSSVGHALLSFVQSSMHKRYMAQEAAHTHHG